MTEPFLTLKTGDPFISLEQFLGLPEDSFYDRARRWGVHMSGDQWLFRYKLAKDMWEKFGNEPPMEATVFVIVNGHGTSFPELTKPSDLNWLPKRLLTKYKDDTGPYYYLIGENNKSLLDKVFWWRSIVIL